MDAHSIDSNFAFPDLAKRLLEEDEIASDKLEFPPAGDEPLGVFRGLVAAAVIQTGFVLVLVLGWQVWRFFR
jgi:hypothetical protein